LNALDMLAEREVEMFKMASGNMCKVRAAFKNVEWKSVDHDFKI